MYMKLNVENEIKSVNGVYFKAIDRASKRGNHPELSYFLVV